MDYTFFIGPIIGGIIGLITNAIAIKMLFRPLYPVKILGKTLPFTPGIIPKERKRIAASVGRAVGNKLITTEAINRTLLSEQMTVKIETYLDDQINSYKYSDKTIGDILSSFLGDEKAARIIASGTANISEVLYSRVCEMDLGNAIADAAIDEIKDNSMYHTFSFLVSDNMIGSIHGKVADTVENMIVSRGNDLINQAVDLESENLLTTTISSLYQLYGKNTDAVKKYIMNAYSQLIENYLSKAVQIVNIPKMVEDQINQMDLLETERLILSIVNKELNTIVYLGGLLGFILGLLMNFF